MKKLPSHKLNLSNSKLYVHHLDFESRKVVISTATGFHEGFFSFIYLGAPLSYKKPIA